MSSQNKILPIMFVEASILRKCVFEIGQILLEAKNPFVKLPDICITMDLHMKYAHILVVDAKPSHTLNQISKNFRWKSAVKHIHAQRQFILRRKDIAEIS